MRIGSLFAGIGGFDLAARWMGWETAWYSEIDPYASAVMRKHFPDAPNHGDITLIKGGAVEPVDILCGGFPCQDISFAGKGAGITGERSGLWAHYARLIGELRPRYVVIENVPALRSRGLSTVLQNIAALGYDAEWHCIPASAVGAPHQRDRIWIVVYPHSIGCPKPLLPSGEVTCPGGTNGIPIEGAGTRHRDSSKTVAHPHGKPEREPGYEAETLGDCRDARVVSRGGSTRLPFGAPVSPVAHSEQNGQHGARIPNAAQGQAEPSVGVRTDGVPARLDGGRIDAHADESGPDSWVRNLRCCTACWVDGSWESGVPRVNKGTPSRVDRLRCLGNAIVPQVAYVIFRGIQRDAGGK